MEEQKIQKTNKKNHWTQIKVDTATKNINKEIYERNKRKSKSTNAKQDVYRRIKKIKAKV